MSDRALSLLIHGSAKIGKTTFAMTAPYPRLLLDVEAASRFLVKNVKTYWDPSTGGPPVADGTWDTCVVRVRTFQDALNAYGWLNTGQHQFRSVILDSLSELQTRAMEATVGREAMKTQDWGELLRKMRFFCGDLRDLTTHQANPLEAVVITAMSQVRDGVTKPHLQGQLASVVPYLYDVCGYLYAEQETDTATGELVAVRQLLTDKHPAFEAGGRVQGLLPPVIPRPSIDEMLTQIFGPRPEAPAVTTNDEKES